jgi:hypothetical protein
MQGDRDGSPEYEDLGPYSFTGFWSEFPRIPLLGSCVNKGAGFVRQRVYKSCRNLAPYPIVFVREGDSMGINRWQGGIEPRKINEKEAKAGDIEEEISK